MEDCSVDAKRLSIADVAFKDDYLIDSSSSRSLYDHHGESPKSAEQEGSKKFQRYNSRKSLGWDSEFLNSPGVLEPDELTSMIESAEKTEKSAVPKIQERQKSTDSKSALVSEILKTAGLQDGSSEDTRASVQRSGKASRVENSSGKARSVVPDSHTNQSPKKKELASHGKLKPKPSSMKLSAGTPKSGKAANPLTIHPRVLQLRSNYSGGQSGSSSSEPPRAETHSPVVSSTKRNSRAEKKNAESAAGKRASSSKIHQSSVSHSMISPGPSSSRSASSPTAAKKAMNSSVDSFVSASSSSTIKSAAVITEPTRSTYASVLKKPAPPRTSPATSVGVRSSKSTSSIPTTMQRSKSTRASTAISSLNTPPHPLVTSKQSNDGKMLSGQKTRLAAPSSTQNGRNASMGRGTNSVKPSSASQFEPSSSARLSNSTMSPASSSSDRSISSTSNLSTPKPRSSSAAVRMGQSYQREAVPGSLKSPKPSNEQPSSASQFQPQTHRSSSARLTTSTISPASSSPDGSVRSTSSLSTTKPRSSSATMHRSSSARLSASTLSPASSSPDRSVSSTSSLSTTKTRSSSATVRMGQSYQKEAAPGPLKSPKPSNDQQLDGQKTKMSAWPAQHGRSASTGRLVVKPSALQMPSPKIGFSDGVKSGRTPKGTKQQPPNLVPGGLPKSGAKTAADANESTNKLKFGSIPSPRSTMTIGSKKAENNKQSRSPREPSSSAEKVSSRSSQGQPKMQDSKSGKRNASKEGGSTVRSRDKESRPSEVQTVKNHHSIGVKVGGENSASKLELAASNELVKTVDSSSEKVSEISSPEVSLSAKADQSTGGGRRMPSEMETVKNHSIEVKVGGENSASKLELAASNEKSVKTVDSSSQRVSEISSSTLSAKADQSTGGGRRMPSEMQSVKNHHSIEVVKVGGENPGSKLELAASNESVKSIDSSSQKVSEISSSALQTKLDQSSGGGRMPFAAIHCNKDGSSDGLTGLTQVEKKITISSSSSPEDALDRVESSRY